MNFSTPVLRLSSDPKLDRRKTLRASTENQSSIWLSHDACRDVYYGDARRRPVLCDDTNMRTWNAVAGLVVISSFALQGCGTLEEEYCDAYCGCTGVCQERADYDDCVRDIEIIRDNAELAGCGAEFDSVLTCIADADSCDLATACAAEGAAYDACTQAS